MQWVIICLLIETARYILYLIKLPSLSSDYAINLVFWEYFVKIELFNQRHWFSAFNHNFACFIQLENILLFLLRCRTRIYSIRNYLAIFQRVIIHFWHRLRIGMRLLVCFVLNVLCVQQSLKYSFWVNHGDHIFKFRRFSNPAYFIKQHSSMCSPSFNIRLKRPLITFLKHSSQDWRILVKLNNLLLIFLVERHTMHID